MTENESSGPWSEIKLQALQGLIPRHILDLDLRHEAVDASLTLRSRAIVEHCRTRAEELCDKLESQSHELSVLEDEGLSGRVRYLCTIATAAYHCSRISANNSFEGLIALHVTMEMWRAGASHDLSNAFGALLFNARRNDDAHVLGVWIWLNLAPADAGIWYQWVASSMRFADGFGKEVILAAEQLGTTTQSPAVSTTHISIEDARAIAEDYIAANPGVVNGTRVKLIQRFNELEAREPVIYGVDLSRCWIAYVEQPGIGLRSSHIIAVSEETGAVIYAGSANDEG